MSFTISFCSQLKVAEILNQVNLSSEANLPKNLTQVLHHFFCGFCLYDVWISPVLCNSVSWLFRTCSFSAWNIFSPCGWLIFMIDMTLFLVPPYQPIVYNSSIQRNGDLTLVTGTESCLICSVCHNFEEAVSRLLSFVFKALGFSVGRGRKRQTQKLFWHPNLILTAVSLFLFSPWCWPP